MTEIQSNVQKSEKEWPFIEGYNDAQSDLQHTVFHKHPLVEHLGFELADASAGYFRIDLPWQENLSNYGREIHGGIHATLVDSVSGQAIFTLLKRNYGLSTISLNTLYHLPFSTGVLKAEGWVTKWGKNVCHTKAVLSVGDKIIAEGNTSYSIFEHSNTKRTHWTKDR